MSDDPIALAAAERLSLLEDLEARPRGFEWCESHAAVVDRLVRRIWVTSVEAAPSLSRAAVLAVGGYGRRELSPHSDVDVMVVPGLVAEAEDDAALKTLYKALAIGIGSLGLRLGYAICRPGDAPGLDAEAMSSLMDARVVVGELSAGEAMLHEVWQALPVAEFVLAKIGERESAMAKTHDSPGFVRPHLKEGAGGLRSFQAASWIRQAAGERPLVRPVAYDVVLRARNLLHLEAGRALDTVDHARRASIALRLGISDRELGSQFCSALTELDRAYRDAVESLHNGRLRLGPGVEAIRGEVRFSRDATLSGAALGVSHATKLGIPVPRGEFSYRPEVDPSEVMRALASGEATVRSLDACGVLDGLLPELTACRDLMPDDPSHDFSVFEHTLRVVRNLDTIPDEGFLSQVRAGIGDTAPLFLAALIHDVGKVDASRPHSLTGAEMAVAIGKRWGLYSETVEVVEWLVREHLTMARVLRTRDVNLPETAHDFAKSVGDTRRLDMLALLTWADVTAVHPQAWTPVLQSLHQELYLRTRGVIESAAPGLPTAASARERHVRAKSDAEPGSDVAPFVDAMPAHYVISTSPEDARRHHAMARRAESGTTSVEIVPEPELHISEATVVARDAPGHLSRILGVFYALDISVHGLRASTTSGSRPVLVDTFTLSFGDRPLPAQRARRAETEIARVLAGETTVEELLESTGKDPGRVEPVLAHNFVEGSPGILELRSTRGRGMPYRHSRLIAGLGWNVLAARLGQWAGMGSAAFYITGAEGAALSADEVARALERAVVRSAAP